MLKAYDFGMLSSEGDKLPYSKAQEFILNLYIDQKASVKKIQQVSDHLVNAKLHDGKLYKKSEFIRNKTNLIAFKLYEDFYFSTEMLELMEATEIESEVNLSEKLDLAMQQGSFLDKKDNLYKGDNINNALLRLFSECESDSNYFKLINKLTNMKKFDLASCFTIKK